MPEPDFPALLRRLDSTAENPVAAATLEILERIGDALPAGGAGEIVQDTLRRAKGIAFLRVSDARPTSDPVSSARSTAQYVLAMLSTLPIETRVDAIAAFISAANHVFADLRTSGASVVGTIYYIRYSGQAEIKIGYATSLKARLRALGTGTPFGIELMASHVGTLADEAALHRRFAHLRITAEREWFRPADELLQHISACENAQDVIACQG